MATFDISPKGPKTRDTLSCGSKTFLFSFFFYEFLFLGENFPVTRKKKTPTHFFSVAIFATNVDSFFHEPEAIAPLKLRVFCLWTIGRRGHEDSEL